MWVFYFIEENKNENDLEATARKRRRLRRKSRKIRISPKGTLAKKKKIEAIGIGRTNTDNGIAKIIIEIGKEAKIGTIGTEAIRTEAIRTEAIRTEARSTREKEARRKTETKTKIEGRTSNIRKNIRRTGLNLMKSNRKINTLPLTSQNIDDSSAIKLL